MGAQKVFGIGLSRTATMSLTSALRALGFPALHFPSDARTRDEIYRYFEAVDDARDARLELSILAEYDALTDIPVCCTYQGLDRAYPGSRFILTRRDKDAWLRSCERFWSQMVMPFIEANSGSDFVRYLCAINTRVYGRVCFDQAAFSRAYDEYHAGVRDYFRDRPGQLLTLDVAAGEGWEKLAPFLDRPIPDEPFPMENRLRPPHEAAGDGHTAAQDLSTDPRIASVQTYADAFRARDLAACMAWYADDALLALPNRQIRGYRAIEEWHREAFSSRGRLDHLEHIAPADDGVTMEVILSLSLLRVARIKIRGQLAVIFDADQRKITQVRFKFREFMR
ncbi:MAG TPA: sulfotransferase [Thermomicrobiaceae bacterium]|nr:sulfotransferase [Thermomicrobiaceae bacterium]